MFLRRFFPKNRKAKAARSPLENDRPPSHASNVTMAPTHTDGADSPNDRIKAQYVNLPGRDFVALPEETESSLANTLDVIDASQEATPRYIYYRIYAEDGAIPSKTFATPGNPFLGRINARYVPPPHIVQTVKRCIAKVENIKDYTSTNLFLTPYSQSAMGDANEVTILNRTGPGSTPQEPLALVAKMSDAERSALESGGRREFASAAEPDSTTYPEIRYLYYQLYTDDYVKPSKVAINPEELSLGRIRADSVAPPHSAASIKRCISRVEETPALAYADLFADISCKNPLKQSHISILRTDCPGLSPNKPMAIVLNPILQVQSPPIPDGMYLIKNRAADIYWIADNSPIRTVYFWASKLKKVKNQDWAEWNITNDTNGNIFMTSLYAPSSWVGAEITGSTVPVPWRLIPADSNFYYLTTDINRVSQNPRVPATQRDMSNGHGLMVTLKEGDQWQMWEFIRV